jgi:hypothetical protein
LQPVFPFGSANSLSAFHSPGESVPYGLLKEPSVNIIYMFVEITQNDKLKQALFNATTDLLSRAFPQLNVVYY